MERGEGFNDLFKKLEEEGFTVEFATPAVPIQIEGLLPDGKPFYFRSRGEHASLVVGEVGMKYLDRDWVNTWEKEKEIIGEPYAAGWLDPEEAEAIFREFLEDYQKSQQG